MKNILKKTGTVDTSETVQAPGVNRRTALIIGLALACLATSLMMVGLGGDKSPSPNQAVAETPVDPTYGGVFTLPVTESIVDEATQEAVAPPSSDGLPAWAEAPAQRQYATIAELGGEDPLDAMVAAVQGGGGLFHSGSGEKAGGTPPSASIADNATFGAMDDRTLIEGTLIPAVLESPLNSERPGPVSARVLHDVNDTKTLTNVLIPAGTRVLGNMAVAGEAIAVDWHRLIYPDGRTKDIGSLPALDQGGAGIAGSVNRHGFANFGRGFLTALIGATTSIGAATLSRDGGIIGGALGLQLGQTASTMQQIKRSPTIKVPTGHQFDIWVETDLRF